MATYQFVVTLVDPEDWEKDWIEEAIEQAPVDCQVLVQQGEV